jgi:hypothetical protein
VINCSKSDEERGLTIPMHTDRRGVVGWSSGSSAAGDWGRYPHPARR